MAEGPTQRWYDNSEGDVSGMAILRRPTVEHGHGARQERHRHRIPLRGAGGGHAFARGHLLAHPLRMARYDRCAACDHGTQRTVASQSAARTLDTQQVSLSRSPEPYAARALEALSWRRRGRERGAGHPFDHQRDRGWVAQQWLERVAAVHLANAPGLATS